MDKLLNFSVLGFSFAKEIKHLPYKAVVMCSRDSVLEDTSHGAQRVVGARACQFDLLVQGRQLRRTYTHVAGGRLIYKI